MKKGTYSSNSFLFKNVKKLIFLFLLLFALSAYFYKDTIRSFPAHIHAWAQSDHYALALGFERNGLDFFHPETYNLNLQFPAKKKLSVEQGITAVDFPINNYVVALIMKLTGKISPGIFRFYLLIYSCIGLVFLFLLAQEFSGSFWFGCFTVLFTFTAPVFNFYQDGFLPTIASLANIFIASFFYYNYNRIRSIRFLYASIFFYTLAALCRTPFSIFLIAVLGIEILKAIETKKIETKTGFAFLVSILSIVSYFLYNTWLRKNYGSIFLSFILPPNSFVELRNIIKETYHNWFFQYFTGYHYLIMLGLIVFFLLVWIIEKRLMLAKEDKWLILFIGISGIGTLAYFLLMAKQFEAHDYYFLDTFFAVIIFVLVFLGSVLRRLKSKNLSLAVMACFIFLGISMTVRSKVVQDLRNTSGSWDRVETTRQNFSGSDHFLDSLKISRTAKILVIDAYAPNIPFILMDRKGYYVNSTTKEKITQSLTWNYDYVVIQEQFLVSDVIAPYPELPKKLKKITGNGKISIYKKSEDTTRTIFQLIGLDKQNAFAICEINFDANEKYGDSIRSFKATNENFHSSPNCAILNDKMEFGLTVEKEVHDRNTGYALIEGYFFTKNKLSDIYMVATLNNIEKYYQTFNIKEYLTETNKWVKLQFLYPLPSTIGQKCKLGIYLWNSGKNNLFYYDDVKIRLYSNL